LKHKSFLVDVALSKDAVLTVTNSDESFMIQRIINDKGEINLMIIQKKRVITESTQKRTWKNIGFNYDRTVILAQSMKTYFLSCKIIDSVHNVFDNTNRLDNQIWKWFVIFTALSSH
jgi:hypothetical protein